MRLLILFLLLTGWALARTPAEVVLDAFQYDIDHGMKKTIQDRSHCFTPGFRGVFERALALPQGGPAFVDMDYFLSSQDGGFRVATGKTETSGKDATVYVKLWHGPYRGAPAEKEPTEASVKVLLIDLGQGYQIRDIVHLPHGPVKEFSVRDDFNILLKGKWPDR